MGAVNFNWTPQQVDEMTLEQFQMSMKSAKEIRDAADGKGSGMSQDKLQARLAAIGM